MRKTVTVHRDGEPDRDFHLFERQVSAFVASVEASGGACSVGPLKLGDSLRAVLARAGVNADAVR